MDEETEQNNKKTLQRKQRNRAYVPWEEDEEKDEKIGKSMECGRTGRSGRWRGNFCLAITNVDDLSWNSNSSSDSMGEGNMVWWVVACGQYRSKECVGKGHGGLGKEREKKRGVCVCGCQQGDAREV